MIETTRSEKAQLKTSTQFFFYSYSNLTVVVPCRDMILWLYTAHPPGESCSAQALVDERISLQNMM